MSQRTGILLVVSGPSGSGKTTLCRQLADLGEVHYSISCTTREPRPGEVDGQDYHFLTRESFEARLAAGAFLEHAEVHGNFYGTLVSEVAGPLAEGRDVVMDIDVQGAAQVRGSGNATVQRALVDLFVMPADDAELHRRLSGRATDSEETIRLRMANALAEIEHWPLYQYRLLSSTREEDFARFKSLLIAERMRACRSQGDCLAGLFFARVCSFDDLHRFFAVIPVVIEGVVERAKLLKRDHREQRVP